MDTRGKRDTREGTPGARRKDSVRLLLPPGLINRKEPGAWHHLARRISRYAIIGERYGFRDDPSVVCSLQERW